MAIVQEQKVSYDSEADSTTHTLTITEPVQNRLMLLICGASAVLNTPSGWSKAVGSTNDLDVVIFYRIAPASFGTSVQFGSGSSCSASAVYLEYSGIVTTTPLDQTASNTSVGETGTTGTTSQADELAIGAMGAGGTNVDNNWTSWLNSFTEEHDLASSGGSFNASLGVASRILTATGTYITGATNGAGGGLSGCIATFKAAAGGSDQELNVPFFQNSVQIFAPTIQNQANQDLAVPHFGNVNQLFLSSIANQPNQDLLVPFLAPATVLFAPFLQNEGELFEPILAGNGTLADQIMNGLISQGFLMGSLADRERARLLAKLVLTEPQKLTIDDLYELASEDNRIAGLAEPVFA